MNLEELKNLIDLNYPQIFADLSSLPYPQNLNLIKKYPQNIHRVLHEQIECQRKAVQKLPNLSHIPFLYEPVALEQCSSQATAKYKASLVKGEKLIDITGGLGVDTIAFANHFEHVIYCEKNELLRDLFTYNIKQLGISNIAISSQDGIESLSTLNSTFDCIYCDPSRRFQGHRTMDMEKWEPNIVDNLNLFFSKSKTVLFKLSPAIDFTYALSKLHSVNEILVISIHKECKESLFFCSEKLTEENQTSFKAVCLDESGESIYSIRKGKDNNNTVLNRDFQENEYLIEPDPSIIRIGCEKEFAKEYNFYQPNQNISYLGSSTKPSINIGSVFQIIKILTWQRDTLKRYIKDKNITHANVSRRDFPMSPEEFKKMMRLKDGGTDYFFLTKNSHSKPIVIHANRIF